MRRADFEAMVRGMIRELPPPFLDGIDDVRVTPKTVPHPLRADVYTLGECVPHAFGGEDEPGGLRSRVELHFGSFAALARLDPAFDWRTEAWETLTHEVRHHLEWRAREPALEALDEAVEANYARHEGDPFAPLFHLDGERLGAGVTKVEDDVFIDVVLAGRAWTRAAGTSHTFTWHGGRWRVPLPAPLPDVLYLVVAECEPEPAGDLVLVVRRKAGFRDVLAPPRAGQASATATRA